MPRFENKDGAPLLVVTVPAGSSSSATEEWSWKVARLFAGLGVALMVLLLALDASGAYPPPAGVGRDLAAPTGWLGWLTAYLMFGFCVFPNKIPSVVAADPHPLVWLFYWALGMCALYLGLVIYVGVKVHRCSAACLLLRRGPRRAERGWETNPAFILRLGACAAGQAGVATGSFYFRWTWTGAWAALCITVAQGTAFGAVSRLVRTAAKPPPPLLVLLCLYVCVFLCLLACLLAS